MEPAPVVDRKLKPKLHQDESEPKLVTPSKLKSLPLIKSPAAQPTELVPPCIDRKLKPTTPIKVSYSKWILMSSDTKI